MLAQAGTKQASKQASKQAPKPTFSLPSLGGKAQQVGKTAKVKAGSAPQKAKQAASSGKGLFGLAKQAAPQKAKQAASSGKGLFGTASVKAKQAAPQKAKQAASNGKSLFGTASVKAKQAASTTGLFGTASTRGKSSTPAKGGGSLGTRSTRPTSGLSEFLFSCLLLISLAIHGADCMQCVACPSHTVARAILLSWWAAEAVRIKTCNHHIET